MLFDEIGFFLMRKITNKAIMDKIIDMKTKRLGKISIHDNGSSFVRDNNTSAHAQNLTEDGYTILDNKPKERILPIIPKQKPKTDTISDDTDHT